MSSSNSCTDVFPTLITSHVKAVIRCVFGENIALSQGAGCGDYWSKVFKPIITFPYGHLMVK